MGTGYNGIHKWLWKREYGPKNSTGLTANVNKALYSRLTCVNSWNPSQTTKDTHHGGIFNFDFSPDGSLLVAACERKSILMFDPLNGKLIMSKNQAHNDCVNCVRFLDSRMFATCSDDTTVNLWDARFLKHHIRSLTGHSNWVKNIEYTSREEMLVTSGFDGSIYAWDINRYSETSECIYQRVFHTNGLMRTKLTPDGGKLVIATAGGYLMIIHDLDLMNLATDLQGFKPNMYRLMQMSGSPISQGYMYNHIFSQKRNRVELVSDFPQDDEAEMVASLEVHPQGWCVVSRNTSSDESSEWTCVHDIQERLDEGTDDSSTDVEAGAEDDLAGVHRPNMHQGMAYGGRDNESEGLLSSSPSYMLSINANDGSNSSSPIHSPTGNRTSGTLSADEEDIEETTEDEDSEVGLGLGLAATLQEHPDSPHSMAGDQPDGPHPSSSQTDLRMRQPPPTPTHRASLAESVTFIIRSGSQVAERTLLLLGQNNAAPETDTKIHRNQSRLMHFIQEPNVGRGFIKEVCFSSDGRLICSPFGFGIRLFSFNPDCSELCDCVPDRPQQLYELTSNMSHSSAVVTTKFSPVHCLLVSGCLNGKVDFHQPIL